MLSTTAIVRSSNPGACITTSCFPTGMEGQGSSLGSSCFNDSETPSVISSPPRGCHYARNLPRFPLPLCLRGARHLNHRRQDRGYCQSASEQTTFPSGHHPKDG